MNEPVSKKDNRGGARKGTGPKPSRVKLEIGSQNYADLREYCALRKALGMEYVDPVRYLETLCSDRIDSPHFKRELERLRVEKQLRARGLSRAEDSEMEF